MNIAVIGYGFVGKSVVAGFDTPRNNLFIVDPHQGHLNIEELKDEKIDIAFVCVPTPMGNNGQINSSIVEEVINYLYNNTSCYVVLKSTVTPDIISKFTSHPESHRFVYNPEFLTERNAIQDFLNPKFYVFGGREDACNYIYDAYIHSSNCGDADVYYCTPEEASCIKYGINSFLASKVIWMNQFNDVLSKLNNVDYNNVKAGMQLDPRIGKSHMDVPGPDGRRGYGGPCFPKDTLAFLNLDKSFSVLKEVVMSNQKYRQQYENLDQREIEQNITFDIEV